MSCPDPKILKQFAAASLEDDAADAVLTHIETCEHCEKLLRGWETTPDDKVVVEMRSLHHIANHGSSILPSHIDKYEIVEKIGEGGMGVVYKAFHPGTKREVALKILKSARQNDVVAQKRFVQEMETACKWQHINLVHAFDAGTDQNGTPFLVMELLDGEDLQHRINQTGPIPINDAIDWMRQAASGLKYAHENGFVHRDVKPGNLFLTRHGILKILDLGIVKPIAPNNSGNSGVTKTGHVVGSPQFMAPEQFRGDAVDARSDIYSLGCTFAYILTGKSLVEARNRLPVSLRGIVAKMTAGMPDERYQSVAELMTALDSLSTKNIRKLGILAGFAIAVLILLVGVKAMYFIDAPTEVKPPPSQERDLAEYKQKLDTLLSEKETQKNAQRETAIKIDEMEIASYRMALVDYKADMVQYCKEEEQYRKDMEEYEKTPIAKRGGKPFLIPIMPPIRMPLTVLSYPPDLVDEKEVLRQIRLEAEEKAKNTK